MLRWNMVDCDGNDLFHVWSGDYGAFKKQPDLAAENKKLAEQKNLRDRDQLEQAKVQFRQYVQQRNFVAATKLVLKMKQVGGGIVLERDELLAVIKCLQAASHWSDSAPFMAELIARFPDGADLVRIKLAQICLVELKRPGKALEILADVDAARRAAAATCIGQENRRQSPTAAGRRRIRAGFRLLVKTPLVRRQGSSVPQMPHA